jgi:predicted ATPase/DNA-binding XRE family transcriptional regulator
MPICYHPSQLASDLAFAPTWALSVEESMASNVSPTFGDLLRRYRLRAGLTQEELAEKAQLSPRAISDLERGQRNRPWRDTIRLLAEALRLDSSDRTLLEVAARQGGTMSTGPLERGSPAPDAPRRSSLPVAMSSFVGRERAIAEIRQRLSEARLLTLTGPGGSGKTRLAAEVAGRVAAEFPGGVFFVPLAPIRDPRSVLPTVAQVVGVKESGNRSAIDDLSDAFRGRQALLVLDNFEHVAAAAEDVGALLEACPGLTILATSRSPLHLRGEKESPVPPLALPNRSRQLNDLLECESVRLFADRARAVRPDFVVTEQNAATVAEICRRLDGLPLAIELAAARTKLLSPGDLLGRLEARLRVLTGGPRDLPERQQTLRNTIDWSYQLLSDEEKRLFRTLAVFVDGFTLEAVSTVFSGAPIGDADAEVATLDLLDALVDQSLIQRDDRSAETTRWTTLETIREFAGERLAESGDGPTVARAQALYFHERVVGTRVESMVTTNHAHVPITWLERERANLLAALRWFRDEGDVSVGLYLAAAVWDLWYGNGPRSEGREWLRTFLRLTEGGPPTLARASALHQAGLSAIALSVPAAARADLEEGLAIAQEIGVRSAESDFLRALMMMETELGNFAAARERLEDGLPLQRVLADPGDLQALLAYGGDLAMAEGDVATARSRYEESLAAGIGVNPQWSLRLLGFVALGEGDLPSARRYFRDSLDRYRNLDNRLGQVECLNGFAGLALAHDNPERAGRLLGAIATFQWTMFGGGFHSEDRRENERFLAAARVALSEQGFATAWAAGQSITLEEAVDFALADS